ncbi:MAG: class I SAM-dependent methyltransferase [Candidatus Kaelpia imicola]|nr:class I SAM-dependent methyltransferase [Candidatus Kaelpia imicola]
MSIKNYFIEKYGYLYRDLRLKFAIIKARWYDRLLGINAGNLFRITEDNSLYKDMVDYCPTFFGRLEKMAAYLRPTEDDVFADLGCGKGRVIFFMAQQKIKKVIGVELNPELFAIAQMNLKSLRRKNSPIELLNIDAAYFDPIEITAVFLFDPFGRRTLERVLSNIKDSLAANPRKVRIVYYNTRFRQLLDDQDWLIYEGFIENSACLVWRSNLKNNQS